MSLLIQASIYLVVSFLLFTYAVIAFINMMILIIHSLKNGSAISYSLWTVLLGLNLGFIALVIAVLIGLKHFGVAI